MPLAPPVLTALAPQYSAFEGWVTAMPPPPWPDPPRPWPPSAVDSPRWRAPLFHQPTLRPPAAGVGSPPLPWRLGGSPCCSYSPWPRRGWLVADMLLVRGEHPSSFPDLSPPPPPPPCNGPPLLMIIPVGPRISLLRETRPKTVPCTSTPPTLSMPVSRTVAPKMMAAPVPPGLPGRVPRSALPVSRLRGVGCCWMPQERSPRGAMRLPIPSVQSPRG